MTGTLEARGGLRITGKIELFSLDALVEMAAAAGLHVELSVSEAA